MRELTYYVAVSLDGYICGPDGDVSAFPTEGDHIEMIGEEFVDTLPDVALAALGLSADGSRFDTTLMGWNTYAAGFAHTRDPYPHTRQIVFSRSRSSADADAEITVTAKDPVEVARSLKAEPGAGIWLCGGGELAGQLVEEIDRLVLKVNPVLLGDGVRLFGERRRGAHRFDLTRSRAYRSGVVVDEYVTTAPAAARRTSAPPASG